MEPGRRFCRERRQTCEQQQQRRRGGIGGRHVMVRTSVLSPEATIAIAIARARERKRQPELDVETIEKSVLPRTSAHVPS